MTAREWEERLTKLDDRITQARRHARAAEMLAEKLRRQVETRQLEAERRELRNTWPD